MFDFCWHDIGAFFELQNKTLWDTTCMFIWFVGMLGNLLNIIIYGQKNMLSPCNLILWWLAVSDLFELFAIVSFASLGDRSTYISMIYPRSYTKSCPSAVLFLCSIYLLQVFHTITVGLNIMLAFWRYVAITDPFGRRFRCDNHSARKTVFYVYVISFVFGLTVLYALQMDTVLDIHNEKWFVVLYRNFGTSTENLFAALCRLTYGFILRVVPMFLLIVISVKLIFAVSKARRARQHLSTSGTNETENKMDRINTLVIGIILMFIITEIPLALETSAMTAVLGNRKIFSKLIYCQSMFAYIQRFTLLINCCYNVFFYFIISTQYRKTFKLMLHNMRYNKTPAVAMQPGV